MSESSIALNRFGLGARAGDAAPGDGKRWLLGQFDRYDPRPPTIAAAPSSATVAVALVDYYDRQKALRDQYGPRKQLRAAMAQGVAAPPMAMPVPPPMSAPENATMTATAPAPMPAPLADPFQQARQMANRDARQDYAASVAARMNQSLVTETPFVERLVQFWANHFAVSADKLEMVALSGSLEFEAIRPHVLGRFADMLNAVERHPAMLIYLDQAVSVGPNSQVGQRAAARGQKRVGLNENLAREIMELHTLGVRSVYTQADVTEFARAMTGWTVAGIGRGPGARLAGQDGAPGSFTFVATVHEPGDRTIVGKRYPAGGEAQAQAVLTDLAASAATAQHLATKLARHFAGDNPPPAMVARLKAAYLQSNGDLPTVYRAIVASPEAWATTPVKFRNPWEWSVAAYRAMGTRQVQPGAIVGLLNQLGQPTWKPGQPVGWDDITGSWAGPDAIMRRVEAAERFAARAPEVDARALGAQLFPAALTPATAQAVARAESPAQGLALLLVSPEMMRR
ncbi:uncharacterized protein (DUF1800 family) [Sphingomonas jinjuensis]|uniref:Uncharacterized protein (DUF1800 family) n=1 Tax=Sphingomonas jinjuensis TaxID=535907 RepID=A0A840FD71_9SPHN|nr:DUF1800 domain-containing protein [Sphingomonas jinjuensis]MBB4154711.1 uncharacterized protein (DUF1800 family) [Sphingomonas jinjuensis]